METRTTVRTALWVAAVALLGAALPARGGAQADTLTLGAAASLTGKYSTNGKNTLDGYRPAVKRVNELGGVKVGGKTYRLAIKYYDDESTSARGAQLVERLITQDGIKYVLVEISRALIMEPDVLLVDEPSIGLEPRYIDVVFEALHRLRHEEGKTILLVEQNAKKGLEFADVGYVLVAGRVALAASGEALLEHPEVGRLFLGG